MAICKRCNKNEEHHELEMPNKGFVLKAGKKVEVCEGFQSFDPKLLEQMEPKVTVQVPKVIA